ncbi:hypothetical protein Moror_8269 [Moniliophthora roreri MCA 2997]|uniref:Uncharacterized protein n=1 Tax=Moniliophthora roreri (strain MCA 2997) TaxID=1381753 RepID=V2YRJ2_MONRO|nr:hypothetical protein Moror_8269 [Moniliophthora roreri MCA 2997]
MASNPLRLYFVYIYCMEVLDQVDTRHDLEAFVSFVVITVLVVIGLGVIRRYHRRPRSTVQAQPRTKVVAVEKARAVMQSLSLPLSTPSVRGAGGSGEDDAAVITRTWFTFTRIR